MKIKPTIRRLSLASLAVILLTGCITTGNRSTNNQASKLPETAQTEAPRSTDVTLQITPTMLPTETQTPKQTSDGVALADVLAVSVSGQPGAYSFSVQIASPDLGCQQYADWWEVLDEDGNLIYRRILLHSHVNEQPFTRSGGPVSVTADMIIWVRAHMSPGGYGGAALKGTAADGFEPAELSPDFAAGLEETEPLPVDCAF